MRIQISILCDCGKPIASFNACKWTDYSITDWSTNVKCLECQEKEMAREVDAQV